MLRLILPRRLHRFAYRLAHALRASWWRLAKPRVIGCFAVAVDGEGRVLLVRHSYGRGHWQLPGGGIRRGEDPVLAAARELLEETGCRMSGAQEVACIEEPLHGTTNEVHVIVGETRDTPVADGREIVAARFFSPGDLPAGTSRTLPERLAAWLTKYHSSLRGA